VAAAAPASCPAVAPQPRGTRGRACCGARVSHGQREADHEQRLRFDVSAVPEKELRNAVAEGGMASTGYRYPETDQSFRERRDG
jgi:hypothetical protein